MVRFKWVLIAGFCIFAGGAFFYWSTGEGKKSSRSPALEFALKDAAGRVWSLNDAGERPVVLHFWASWCAPCIEEFPAFVRFAEKMGPQGVQFVAVSLDRTWSDAQKVIPTKLPEGLKILIDPDSRVANQYGSYQFPETYLMSSKREIVMKWVGSQKWEGPQLEAFIGRFLRDRQSQSPH
jgi:thiol-disulfide isomerase/thioredoxin